MADYFSENEAFIISQTLPSSNETPHISRRTSRYGTPVPESALEPEGVTNNENLSPLDPRRFTPTLQANLVSEILNLRRELDSKDKFIDDVEATLYTVRTENESMTKQLSLVSKENKAHKRQFRDFEKEMLAALEEIAGERDQVKEANADLKTKLEAAEKKTRSQDNDSNHVHEMWAKEKEEWAGEKRGLERRVHVSEARLKLLLEEIAAQEASRAATLEKSREDSAQETPNAADSDAGSINSSPRRQPASKAGRHSRNISNGSYKSIGRNFRMSLMSMEGNARGNGISLADELIFDEEEEEDADDDELDEESDFEDYPEHEMRARKALESRQSLYPDCKAKRILGLHSNNEQPNREQPNKEIPTTRDESEQNSTASEMARSPISMTSRDVTLVFPPMKPRYVDSGVQPSSPPSPVKPTMTDASSQTTSHVTPPSKPTESTEVEANQSRKRISVPMDHAGPPRSAGEPLCLMISSSVQTIEQPLSPPATPTVSDLPALPPSPAPKTENTSVSTQTVSVEDVKEPAAPKSQKNLPPPISIPCIAIHAPDSVPPSPRAAILPPGTKTISTQTTMDLVAPIRSFGMQTDPIRIDQRPVKLPAYLLPSAISSKPGTPEPKSEEFEKSAARRGLTSMFERVAGGKIEDRYPGNNDNGPLSRDNMTDILSRPFRTSSLFAGFEGPSSDEEDSLSDTNEGPSAPVLNSSRNAKNGRPVKPPTPVPEDKESVTGLRMSEDSMGPRRDRSSFDNSSRIGKKHSLNRQPSIRRSAMIHNGTAAHTTSNQASGKTAVKPPFPVPQRSSSRGVPQCRSDGSQSPSPDNSSRASRPFVPRHQRRDSSVRKGRSTAAGSRIGRNRSISPSLSVAPSISDTASIPPLPSDIVSVSGFTSHRHRRQPSNNTAYTANTVSAASSNSQANVVDAIAAAMIGEFMWKYVRKRKAFGTGSPEVPAEAGLAAEEASLATNGVRHRRWVWISPYERAILWSSKQPTSGSALMGKSGRKLTIQSVLDVADTCAPPRNEKLFNRSILILTPARALKFTAVSRERHYLWLNALSFLSQTATPVGGDINSLPSPLESDEPPPIHRTRPTDAPRKGKQKEKTPSLPSLSGYEPRNPSLGSASPPTIPRGPIHGRKRSSTGPSPTPHPLQPYRSFSHQHLPSTHSNTSADTQYPPSAPSSVYNPTGTALSARTSEASTSTRSHFLDAMGTVRMEAFIDTTLGGTSTDRAPSAASKRCASSTAASRRRRGSASQWSGTASVSTRDHGVRADDVSEELFRGF